MSNFKKLVDARRRRTGESYQSAARHIRRKTKPFEHVVRHVIALGREAAEYHLSKYSNGILFSDHLEEFLKDHKRRVELRSQENVLDRDDLTPDEKLEFTLLDLPYATLLKLEALMYSGRDGLDVKSTYLQLPKDDQSITAHNMAEKIPLAEVDPIRQTKNRLS